MQRNTKITSVFLTLVIVVSIFSITASAIGETSGTCGDNLNWILDLSTETLTISGTGSMTDYSSSLNSPWKFWRSSIKTVIIEDGVTSIGDYSFYFHQEIISVTIPDSVMQIGDYAFKDCLKLESIRIPDKVTVIGSRAFSGCQKITSITIPNGVTTIEEMSFFACYNLSEVTIPDSVISIGESAFKSCGKLKSITIGSGVEAIGKWAFARCDSLTEVTIPANVTTIERIAVSDCESLEKIIVDSNNPYYSNDDYGVLFNKDKTTLMQYPSGSASTKYTIPDGVTTLCTYAFCYAPNLESVTIPDSVTTLEDFVFDNYKYDLILYYNGSQTQWDELLTNNSETSEYLKNYTVICTDNTTYPSGACGNNLIWMFNAETNTLTISGTGAMYDYEINDVSGFINQPWYEFSRNIKHIVIEDGVTSIGEAAFASCDFTDIIIGDSVASIGSEALDHCNELTNIIVDEDNPYYSNDEYGVLFNKDKATLIYYPLGNIRDSYSIPDTVTTIGTNAFDKCGEILASVSIPKSVTTIQTTAFNMYGILTRFDVYYLGTEAEWNKITIESNFDLTNRMNIHFAEPEHTHKYATVVTPPTCTENGYTTYTCECGDTYVDDYIDALGHSHTLEITTPATHTTTGIMTYTCACGDSYTEVIAKLEKHNYESVVTAPTCTEQGYTTYTCECGDIYIDDYVDALGHTEKIIPAVAPTCTETGFTEGAKCSVCGETLTEQKELSANGHTPANAVEENYITPTCTENGSKDVVVYCSICEDEICRESVVINATGHSYTTAVTAPTCIEQGYTTYTCSCGDNYVDDYVNATGHADNDGDGYCDADNELLDPSVECDHRCHNNGFIWKIINFFNKLFGLNKVCECGAAHY